MKTKWGEKGESRTCTATTGKQRRARGVHERKRVGTWKGFGFFSETCIHFIFCSTTSKLTRPSSTLQVWKAHRRRASSMSWTLTRMPFGLDAYLQRASTRTWSAPRRVPKRASTRTEARPDAHGSAPRCTLKRACQFLHRRPNSGTKSKFDLHSPLWMVIMY